MRDIALSLVFFGLLPFVFQRPYIGIYIWTWLSLMNPHRLTWGFAAEFPFAQIVAIAVMIAIVITKTPVRVPWTRETILLLVFIGWMQLTTVSAIHPDLAWQQWGKVWKIMLMVYITMALIDTRRKLDWLVWIVVLSIGLYSVKGGIFTILTGGAFRVQGPYGSFISGNNELGLAMIMIVPLMRYLQLQAENLLVRHGLSVAMFLTGIAIIGTQSRGALVGILAMGLFLLMKSRRKFYIVIAIFSVAAAVAAIMPQEWYDRMNTIQTYEEDASATGRINAWWMAYNIANDRVLGGGFETFQRGVFRTYAPDPYDVHDSHSVYFEVLGEHGWIGFGLFMLLAILAWRRGSDLKKQAKLDSGLKWVGDLASMLQVSMVGYAVAGLFLGLAYFDLYYTVLAMVVLGGSISKQVWEPEYRVKGAL